MLEMPKPFKGVINVDITESVPDWGPYAQPVAPEGAPTVLYIVLDDVGFSRDGAVRRDNRDAEHQPPCRPGPHLHELSYDGALFTDALMPDDWAQPHDEWDGDDHGGVVRVPELERPHPVRVRDD